jgi:excisionase family DNA binding protein
VSDFLNGCAVCGVDDVIEHHHIVPRAAGGPDAQGNMITLCPTHHRRAHIASSRVRPWPSTGQRLITVIKRYEQGLGRDDAGTSSDLLTVQQAAERFKVHPGSIYRWTYQRKLPFVRLGSRAIRLRSRDLEHLVHVATVDADPRLAFDGMAPEEEVPPAPSDG